MAAKTRESLLASHDEIKEATTAARPADGRPAVAAAGRPRTALSGRLSALRSETHKMPN